MGRIKMSNKAIFVKVKDVSEAMYLDLLDRCEDSGMGDDVYGDLIHIGSLSDDTVLGKKGNAIARVTSYGDNFINELKFYKIKFHHICYAQHLLDNDDSKLKKLYESIYSE